MKHIITILVFWISLFLLSIDFVSATSVNIPWTQAISQVSIWWPQDSDLWRSIDTVWRSIIRIVTRILAWVMVIYVVYIGIQMIISMGSDEEKLSAAKRQLWYMLVALVFINIPYSLFEAFYRTSPGSVWTSVASNFDNPTVSSNIFFNFTVFQWVVNNIIFFLEIMIFAAAIFMITLTGIRLLVSRGREESVTEAKNKILYSILAIIFVGIIEAWKRVAFSWNIPDGTNLFASLANLALFFAAPVAIFFLTLAGYYYITSNGDEERAKKAKSIIINTVIATLILLAAYTFLLELSTL